MSRHLDCPNCQGRYTLPDERPAGIYHCPKCSQLLEAPASTTTTPTEATSATNSSDELSLSERREAQTGSRKTAFTFIRRTVGVVAGLLLLLGLAVTGIKFLTWTPRSTLASHAAHDIKDLDGAVKDFMQKYNVDFVPSQLKVCQNANSYGPSTLDQESLAYICKTIGKNSPSFYNPLTGQGTWQTDGIRWVQGMPAGSMEILEGHQVLVFLLGGIVTNNGSQLICARYHHASRSQSYRSILRL